jgi:hypothetical protein
MGTTMTRLYHRTDFADAILASGFKDGRDDFTDERGVWFSDRPLDSNEGAKGNTLLAIEIPEDVLAPFEWLEDEKTYREWFVPAAVLKRFGPPVVVP